MEKLEPSEVKTLVKDLVEKNHAENDINYNTYFANHAVHGVCTLFSLGATKERIEEYYRDYATKLEPLRPPKFKIDDSNWEDYIMDRTAYAEYLPFFEAQINTHGVEKCFAKFLPRLLPGFIGAAQHPLIQIGFGLEYGFPSVVAEGLSYACTFYFKVGEIVDRLPKNDAPSLLPLDIVKEMQGMDMPLLPEDRKKFNVDRIVVKYNDELALLVSKWKVDGTSPEEIIGKLDELAYAIVVVTFGSYWNDKIDFLLMHCLTSIHAVRVLLPYLPMERQKHFLRVMFVGLLANMWLAGMPKFEMSRIMEYGGSLENLPSWDEIIQKCISREDEHVFKVTRYLVLLRDMTSIPNEMLRRAAHMTTQFVNTIEDWDLSGVGFSQSNPMP